MEQKYRYSCKKDDNITVVVVLDNELDEHLSRHLSMMILGNRPSMEITEWLKYRGYEVKELFMLKDVN